MDSSGNKSYGDHTNNATKLSALVNNNKGNDKEIESTKGYESNNNKLVENYTLKSELYEPNNNTLAENIVKGEEQLDNYNHRKHDRIDTEKNTQIPKRDFKECGNYNDIDLDENESLLSSEEVALQDERLQSCKDKLLQSEKLHQDWCDSMTRRRMFAKARLRKLSLVYKERKKFYDEVQCVLHSPGSSSRGYSNTPFSQLSSRTASTNPR